MTKHSALQFKITLLDIEPVIWRRIQVPDTYTFWDLHVAIQDAMGWEDCHLHQFHLISPDLNQKVFMGIPDDDGFDINEVLSGWEYKVKGYLKNNKKMLYEYDFGDGWMHKIEYEALCDQKDTHTYPVCLDGARACPPEDVGGVPGYYHFLDVILDPQHEEHESMLTWIDGCYDPNKFDAKAISFDNPKRRWEHAFSN